MKEKVIITSGKKHFNRLNQRVIARIIKDISLDTQSGKISLGGKEVEVFLDEDKNGEPIWKTKKVLDQERKNAASVIDISGGIQ